MDDNVYAPPKANLIVTRKNEGTENIIRHLESESTLTLFFFTRITLGVYCAHYIRRQSRILNEYLVGENRISERYLRAIMIFAYGRALLFLANIFLSSVPDIGKIYIVFNWISGILMFVWAFMARAKMNKLLDTSKGLDDWFHWFWTLLFQVFYFNFKINRLNKIYGQLSKYREGYVVTTLQGNPVFDLDEPVEDLDGGVSGS